MCSCSLSLAPCLLPNKPSRLRLNLGNVQRFHFITYVTPQRDSRDGWACSSRATTTSWLPIAISLTWLSILLWWRNNGSKLKKPATDYAESRTEFDIHCHSSYAAFSAPLSSSWMSKILALCVVNFIHCFDWQNFFMWSRFQRFI